MIRISTLARLAEDAVISGASNVARRAKRVVRSTKDEMAARRLAQYKLDVERADAELAGMTKKQRAALLKEQAQINARADEIIAKRRSK